MGKANSESKAVNTWVRELLVKERDARKAKGEPVEAVAVGAAVWGAIRRQASIGNAIATAAINLYGNQRLVNIAGQVCRGDAMAARVYQNGDVVTTSVTERYATRTRTDDGTVDGSEPKQYALWVDLSWDDLMRLIADHQRQADKLEQNTVVFGRALLLRDEFPEAKNAREACALAGIAIEDLLLAA